MFATLLWHEILSFGSRKPIKSKPLLFVFVALDIWLLVAFMPELDRSADSSAEIWFLIKGRLLCYVPWITDGQLKDHNKIKNSFTYSHKWLSPTILEWIQ